MPLAGIIATSITETMSAADGAEQSNGDYG
jgi:hypothetical protein